ncbi:hypothetical protein LFM09_15140 [Lentzea alba]|uniref:hypothetical protein n=1 Tax=Lentzea alba TaxID=2714351 RepID=UPI0039BFEE06
MNDFLMAAASTTAGAPDTGALEVLAEAGLDVTAEIADTPALKPVLTANPNRTKAPARQEVNR